MIEFVKFFDSTSKEVVTYFTKEQIAHPTGQTFEFASPEEAQAKSETNVFIFWDNSPIGTGTVATA